MSLYPPSVRVVVSYGLQEYMATLDDFIQLVGNQEASRSWIARVCNSRFVQKIGLALIAPPVFVLKKLLLGDCTFEFSAQGLQRTSKRRTAVRSWGQVKAVHVLSRAYLIELEEGALPVPYRVFSPEQKSSFERLVSHALRGGSR